ncbi:MAG: ROK family protein [Hyphomicrobiales bacterium]|nr:ROK family protein [Hyphomicrobiales bacterium]MCP5374127.1 ROK family protein [Hyphomicrobiales bacterium]
MAHTRIGIDLGGTKIEGIVLDGDGHELARRRVPTPAGDYAATVAAVAGLVRGLEAGTSPGASVGVGIPGTLSPASGRVKNANSTCLIGEALDRDLAQALGRPVRLANDANCFAVSEAVDGAAAGHGVVFGVILGTGVGGGIAIDGRALTGRNAIAGEWGHNPLPWPGDDERPGPPCYCGRSGCIETFLSGPGLARDHGSVTRAQDIADDDPALDRYVERLARALAHVINILDPDAIVLGGGLSNLDRLYAEVPGLWQGWTFSDSVDTPLLRNRHGDSSGVRGAAWLWPPA